MFDIFRGCEAKADEAGGSKIFFRQRLMPKLFPVQFLLLILVFGLRSRPLKIGKKGLLYDGSSKVNVYRVQE